MKKVVIVLGPTAVGKSDIAVNLAKKFSTDQSGAFVNGVLAALVKKYRGDEVK